MLVYMILKICFFRFLATGNSYQDLRYAFRVGVSTIKSIVQRTMKILWEVLQPIHLGMVDSEDFHQISDDFFEKTGMPHVLGAIDGRHVPIIKPPKTGSRFRNYKGYYSMVLQAVVDAYYRYIFIDVGGRGSQSDGGTFKASLFYKALKQKKIQIPSESKLPDSDFILPFFFLGDGAYPLMQNLMKPYPRNQRTLKQRLFNKKLSSTRVCVENAFGYTCRKWQILKTTINKSLSIVKDIIKCTCLLHNIIIDSEGKDNIVIDALEDDTLLPTRLPKKNDSEDVEFVVGYGKEVREDLCTYFLKKRMASKK